MSYGFRVKNPAGDIVVDSAALGLVYVGRPTLIAAASYDTSGVSRQWRHWRYQAASLNPNYPPVIAARLQDDVSVQVESMQQLDLFNWEVKVYSASYGSYLAFNEPVAPVLHVFSAPLSNPLGSYGIAVRNSSSQLRWDLSRRPLWLRQVQYLWRMDNASYGPGGFTDSGFGLASGIAAPAMMCSTGGYWSAINPATERTLQGSHAWTKSGSTIFRRPVTHIFEPGLVPGDTSTPFPSYSLGETNAVVIDAANLP